MPRGRIYLVPAWLSEDTDPRATVPAPVLERIRALDAFVVEDARSARRFLAACGHPRPMREIAMQELNEHTAPGDVPAMLVPALEGRDLGILSEAGVPAVADPGAQLVAAAHAEGLAVVPHDETLSPDFRWDVRAAGSISARQRRAGAGPQPGAAGRARRHQVE